MRKIFILCFLLLGLAFTVHSQVKPEFSHEAGYYSSEFSLQIVAGANDSIFYTLNGDIPDEDDFIYQHPISITDRSGDLPNYSGISSISHSYSPWVPATGPIQIITVIRARSKNGSVWSKTTTATYLIHPKGQQRYQIPVVSLVTDSLNLFDYNTGIYVLGKVYDDWKRANPTATEGLSTPANYTQRGDEWERPAHFEFFNEFGNVDLSMNIGIRIQGGGSRSFQQKSFRLYARDEYGTSSFQYPFFKDQELRTYKRLQLRNSGQDWMKTALRDGFMQTLVRHLPFETMAFRQNLLFLNGEFWGIANIRERYDDHYIANKFEVDRDKIDYLAGNAYVQEGSNTHYKNMLSFISSNDLSVKKNYDFIKTQMDVSGFIYYNLANIYFNNRDWPHNNIEYWRYQTAYDSTAKPGLDGRWRWMMFDTDFGFAWTDIHTEVKYQGHVQQNLLEHATRADHWSTFLLHELLKNEEFKLEFINSYRDLMNSTFKKERVWEILDSLKTVIEPYVVEHINRWGNSNHRWSMPHDVEEWQTNINYMFRFANEREIYLNQYMKDQFSLGDLYKLELGVNDPNRGSIQINGMELTSDPLLFGNFTYPNLWSGTYYIGIPVHITVKPKEGYRFTHWENHQTNATELHFTSETSPVVAHFEPEVVSNEKLSDGIPLQTQIFPNYPNPFNPSTTLSFQLNRASSLQISLYSIHGQKLKTFFTGNLSSGNHDLHINLSEFATGMYIYRLETPSEILSGKLTLMK